MSSDTPAEEPLIADEENQIFIRGDKGEVIADTTDVNVVADRIIECATRIAATPDPSVPILVTLETRIPILDFIEIKCEVLVRAMADDSAFSAVVNLGHKYFFYQNTPV